ncbi:MAG TPA: response regulator [Thermodesulfovibrionales bacterium]|nr:response regulator [Thermodesulfovibrionales bacterium]
MPEKLLIVDDEPDMLRLLQMIVREKTAYEVTTTNNPLEALGLARKGGFDLLITDLKMPGLDGIELLKTVREFDADIPIIIITAFATSEAADAAMEKNAFDFITKPFRKEQILFTIEKAIKWLRTQRENKMLRESLGKEPSQ